MAHVHRTGDGKPQQMASRSSGPVRDVDSILSDLPGRCATLLPCPSTDLLHTAQCFLANVYVKGGRTPLIGFYDLLQDIHTSEQPRTVFAYSFRAASLLCFGRYTRTETIIDSAHLEYARAISQLRPAISMPDALCAKTAAVAVLLLGIYDYFVGERSAYADHIYGALALLNSRSNQRATFDANDCSLSAELLYHVSKCALQYRRGVPPQAFRIAGAYCSWPMPFRLAGQYLAHILRASQNIERLRLLSAHDLKIMHTLTDELLHLDYMMRSGPVAVGSVYSFRTIDVAADPGGVLYDRSFHVYSDTVVANLWNIVRTVRLCIHGGICEALQAVAQNERCLLLQTRIEESERHVNLLQEEILASIPQQLGQVKEFCPIVYPSHEAQVEQDRSVFKLMSEPEMEAPRCLPLIWPLWQVGAVKRTSPRMRRYCVRVLEQIGEAFGLREALSLAQDLKDKQL